MARIIYFVAFGLQFMAWLGSGVPFLACIVNFLFLICLFVAIPTGLRSVKNMPFSTVHTVIILALLLAVNFGIFVTPIGIPVSWIPISEMDKNFFSSYAQPTHWKIGVGAVSTALYAFAHIAFRELHRPAAQKSAQSPFSTSSSTIGDQ